MKKSNEIDQYISGFPAETQSVLQKIRSVILKAAPGAEEVISYKMPAYRLNGILVWFAGYKNHIGFYPSGSPILFFKDDLAEYKTSKGAIQFPLDKPLPQALITKIVKHRIKENSIKSKAKFKKK
ncbi:MAG TPA: DUF1801 domain-containing protein [Chitinophagales bacterium]|nr:DUF1801 domain-containing protein [Chitinophagales bacterium]